MKKNNHFKKVTVVITSSILGTVCLMNHSVVTHAAELQQIQNHVANRSISYLRAPALRFLEGYTYYDENNDGQWDYRLSNVQVELIGSDGSVFKSSTNNQGYFYFEGMNFGDFEMRFFIPVVDDNGVPSTDVVRTTVSVNRNIVNRINVTVTPLPEESSPEVPTTETPSTDTPTTETPSPEETTTEVPTTETPSPEETTTEVPTTETPSLEETTTEVPTTETPSPEETTTEAPTAEPTIGAPSTEVPPTETPITEEPTTERSAIIITPTPSSELPSVSEQLPNHPGVLPPVDNNDDNVLDLNSPNIDIDIPETDSIDINVTYQPTGTIVPDNERIIPNGDVKNSIIYVERDGNELADMLRNPYQPLIEYNVEEDKEHEDELDILIGLSPIELPLNRSIVDKDHPLNNAKDDNQNNDKQKLNDDDKEDIEVAKTNNDKPTDNHHLDLQMNDFTVATVNGPLDIPDPALPTFISGLGGFSF